MLNAMKKEVKIKKFVSKNLKNLPMIVEIKQARRKQNIKKRKHKKGGNCVIKLTSTAFRTLIHRYKAETINQQLKF